MLLMSYDLDMSICLALYNNYFHSIQLYYQIIRENYTIIITNSLAVNLLVLLNTLF